METQLEADGNSPLSFMRATKEGHNVLFIKAVFRGMPCLIAITTCRVKQGEELLVRCGKKSAGSVRIPHRQKGWRTRTYVPGPGGDDGLSDDDDSSEMPAREAPERKSSSTSTPPPQKAPRRSDDVSTEAPPSKRARRGPSSTEDEVAMGGEEEPPAPTPRPGSTLEQALIDRIVSAPLPPHPQPAPAPAPPPLLIAAPPPPQPAPAPPPQQAPRLADIALSELGQARLGLHDAGLTADFIRQVTGPYGGVNPTLLRHLPQTPAYPLLPLLQHLALDDYIAHIPPRQRPS